MSKQFLSMTKAQSRFTCFSVPYADLQITFKDFPAQYYNSGVYGWNCDIFTNYDVAITTGYRNTRGKRVPAEIVARHEERARAIRERSYIWDEIKDELQQNINDLYAELAELA